MSVFDTIQRAALGNIRASRSQVARFLGASPSTIGRWCEALKIADPQQPDKVLNWDEIWLLALFQSYRAFYTSQTIEDLAADVRFRQSRVESLLELASNTPSVSPKDFAQFLLRDASTVKPASIAQRQRRQQKREQAQQVQTQEI